MPLTRSHEEVQNVQLRRVEYSIGAEYIVAVDLTSCPIRQPGVMDSNGPRPRDSGFITQSLMAPVESIAEPCQAAPHHGTDEGVAQLSALPWRESATIG